LEAQMRNAAWAEWAIARFVDRRRAASIVGDLLETGTQTGTLGFWLSVIRIVFSLIWRPAAAFVAAYMFGLIGRKVTIVALIHAGSGEPLPSVVWLFGNVLWMAVSYAAIRYGLRDKFAQLALGLCGLVTIVMFYRWKLAVAVACIVLVLTIMVASVRSAHRNRTWAALTTAVVFGFGGSLLLRGALAKLFHYQLVRSDLGTATVSICFWLSAVWITTTACARMHDRLLQRD
jgi:hypothetical protein